VTRGSQVLASDSPTGPFNSFTNHSTLPVEMMTLDGTFWVEDSVPYMVFCHFEMEDTGQTLRILKEFTDAG
jgi:hypothetical protein